MKYSEVEVGMMVVTQRGLIRRVANKQKNYCLIYRYYDDNTYADSVQLQDPTGNKLPYWVSVENIKPYEEPKESNSTEFFMICSSTKNAVQATSEEKAMKEAINLSEQHGRPFTVFKCEKVAETEEASCIIKNG